MSNSQKIIYFKEKYIKSDESHHTEIHALHYSTSVFEGIRVYNGHAFKLQEHANRLIKSAQSIGLNVAMSSDDISQKCKDLIAESGFKNSYLRPLMYLGGPGLGVSNLKNPTEFALLIWEWDNVFPNAKDLKGISITSNISFCRPSNKAFPSQTKASSGYLLGFMCLQEAVKLGYQDALFKDEKGLIAETSSSNIFIVKDEQLITPIPESFLNGITRQITIKIAQELNINTIEKEVTLEEIYSADEVFLTGSAYEIMPVNKVDNVNFEKRKYTKKIKDYYSNLCNRKVALSNK